jgi:hypothetical protein
MERQKGEKNITITGTVVPTDWGKNGTVVAVALSTPAEDEYLVTNNALGQELLQLIGAKVLARGIMTEDENWNRRITLTNYETLEDHDEDEEAEYLGDEDEYYDHEQFGEEQLFEAEEEEW